MPFKIQLNQFQGLISGIQSLIESHFHGDLRSMPTVLYEISYLCCKIFVNNCIQVMYAVIRTKISFYYMEILL